MFIQTKKQQNQYVRLSKLGRQHNYTRTKTLAIFKCDNCDQVFERDLKKIDRKRLSNNYFHCCSSCDTKRFGICLLAVHCQLVDIKL